MGLRLAPEKYNKLRGNPLTFVSYCILRAKPGWTDDWYVLQTDRQVGIRWCALVNGVIA